MNAGSRIAALGMIAVTAVALAGCSAATNTASTPGSTAAGKVEPLVLYAAEAYDANMGKAFTAKTGIPVKVVDDSTGPLLTKVAAEKNNPQWSMLWVDGDTAFAALDKQKELLPYAPSASFSAAGKTLLPADNSYIPTGTTAVAALIYNSAGGAAVPSTYSDLLTSAYSGKVGMNDPSQSGPTYPLIAGLMNQMGGTSNGVSDGEAYLTKLKANGLKVFPTNGDTLHALETKQIQYGLIQSSAAIGEAIKVKPTSTFAPRVIYLPKTTLLPGVIGIDKSIDATQQAESKKFVDFALSPEGQKVMQGADPSGDSLFWPVTTTSTKLPALPELPTTYQRLDPYFWGPLQSQVVTWFDSNIK